MFIVDRDTKKSVPVNEITFASLNLTERYDLQEWIVNEPQILGEELMIIQKEFSGFSDTNERLDLLAVDKSGNLVIIENKLDDSGKDVTWQAMKYASYCSTLSKNDIRNIFQQYLKNGESAEMKLCDFLEKSEFDEFQLNSDLSQRIILVARTFRKEVTSTVLWARKYGVKIQCIKIIPYLIGDKFIVDTEQIIPVKDVSEITISFEEKVRAEAETGNVIAERKRIRDKFWSMLLHNMNERTYLFSGIGLESKHYDHWLSTGSGMSGLVYSLAVTRTYASVELGISKSQQEENKKIFDILFANKNNIEKKFGTELDWQRLDEKKMSRIAFKLNDVNIFNEDYWSKIEEFLITNIIKFELSFKDEIENLRIK